MSIYPTPGGLFGSASPTPPAASSPSVDIRPLARASDPETSKQAARAVARKAKTQGMRLLRLIHEHPGLTVGEMTGRIDMDRAAISKRASDLVKNKYARYGPPRKCGVAHTEQATCWPGETPPPPGVLIDVTA